MKNKLFFSIFLYLIPIKLFAYLGPGMGGGVLAVIVGFFVAIFLAFWGILYYPIKRAILKKRNKNKKWSMK